MFSENYTSKNVPGQKLVTEHILKALRDCGGIATNEQMRKCVIRSLDITPELSKVTFGGETGKNVLDYRLEQGRTKLKKDGLIDNRAKGEWMLLSADGLSENIQPAKFSASRRLSNQQPNISTESVHSQIARLQSINVMTVHEHEGDLRQLLDKYMYQPELTQKLDTTGVIHFTQDTINEIVLWKTNRYARLDSKVLNSLDELVLLQKGQHRKSESILKSLLDTRGVDLPMASTILRFRNPKAFQIIDQRAYRVIYGRKYSLTSGSLVSRKISTYFDYLDELVKLSEERKTPFDILDRVLYELDKQANGTL